MIKYQFGLGRDIRLLSNFSFSARLNSGFQARGRRALTLMSNMRNSPPVVFYRYDASPAAAKAENVLALKGIPHYRVEVNMTLPRPELSEMLGVGYRRIPILAIGNDVYCDTALISNALERTFSPNQGFPTLYPKRKDGGKSDTGMIKALTTFYVDRPLFSLASQCLPYDKFTPEFIADRTKWFGAPVQPEKIIARQPLVRSVLSSHMSLLEEQLADGREFVFDTEHVGYGDLAIYSVYGWIQRFRGVRAVLTTDKFPRALAWLSRMGELIKQKREANASSITKIEGGEAAKIIANSTSIQAPEIIYESEEAEGLGVKKGEIVAVAPDDNAKDYPTIGTLIGLSKEEFVLQVGGSVAPSVRCHFPRFNYTITPAKEIKSKL